MRARGTGDAALEAVRMIAKIAYCYAVAENGIEPYLNSEVRQLVRGERDDFYNFVGGSLRDDRLTQGYLHHLAFRQRGDLQTVLVHTHSWNE